MTEEFDDQDRGWRVVEGPGAEDTDEDASPPDRILSAGPGVAAADIEDMSGPPGHAPGDVPDSIGPTAVIGLQGHATDEGAESTEEQE